MQHISVSGALSSSPIDERRSGDDRGDDVGCEEVVRASTVSSSLRAAWLSVRAATKQMNEHYSATLISLPFESSLNWLVGSRSLASG